MCGSMADIQSAAAEIRRGKKKKKEERRKKPQGKNIMSASATQGGHEKEREKEELQRNHICKVWPALLGGHNKRRGCYDGGGLRPGRMSTAHAQVSSRMTNEIV